MVLQQIRAETQKAFVAVVKMVADLTVRIVIAERGKRGR